MGLQDKFLKDGSLYSGLNGSTPSIPNFKASTLHYEYSINGQYVTSVDPTTRAVTGTTMASAETIKFRPPSSLDLNGVTPEKYIDKIKK